MWCHLWTILLDWHTFSLHQQPPFLAQRSKEHTKHEKAIIFEQKNSLNGQYEDITSAGKGSRVRDSFLIFCKNLLSRSHVQLAITRDID